MAPRGSPPPRRKNGFSRPYSKAQVSAWLALAGTLIEFCLLVTPVLPIQAAIPITLFFVLLVAGVLYYGGLTQLVDPIDVHLRQHLDQNHNEVVPPPQEEMKQCWICDVQVAGHSMHCKFCNKCVYHFDHHCMWLNTCVGSANYKYFFRTMLLIFVMEFVHLIIQIVLLIDSFTNGPTRDRLWINSATTVHAIWIFFIIFNVVSCILIGQLLWFHIGLQRENITTYQYIVRDSKRKRELLRRQEELTNQRIVAVAKAYRENQLLQAWQLRIGGCCRSIGCSVCDPMQLPPPVDPNAGFAAALGGAPGDNHEEQEVETGETEEAPQEN